LIAVPLLALRLPFAFVVPVLSLLDYTASISQGVFNRRLIRWFDLLPLLPFTLLGVIAGNYLFSVLAQPALAVVLGLFIMLYAIYALLPLAPLSGSRLWAMPAGFLGGLVGFLFGTGGPFYVIYFTLRRLDKGSFRANAATIFVIDGGLRLFSYAASGYYSRTVLVAVACALPLTVFGLVVGGRLHTRIGRKGFIRLVSLILLISGIMLLARYLCIQNG